MFKQDIFEKKPVVMRSKLISLCFIVLTVSLANNSQAQWKQSTFKFEGQVKSFTSYKNTLYALDDSGRIFTSVDQAVHWKPLSRLPSCQQYHSLIVSTTKDGSQYLFAGTMDGIFRLKLGNPAAAWEKVLNQSARSLAQTRKYGNVLYACSIDLKSSVDNGDTWNTVKIQKPFSPLVNKVTANDSTFMALCYDKGSNSLYLSSGRDSGNFVRKYYQYELATFAGNNLYYVQKFSSSVFVSTDKGQTWTETKEGLESVPYFYSLFPVNNSVLAGTSNGAFYLDMKTKKWKLVCPTVVKKSEDEDDSDSGTGTVFAMTTIGNTAVVAVTKSGYPAETTTLWYCPTSQIK
jgi:hypothetical protein